MDHWTQGPARWIAAVVLGGASVFGMIWSITARRPIEIAAPARAVGPAVAQDSAPRDVSVPQRPSNQSSESADQPLAGRIDLNTAPAAELELLPGIGPTLAARIVADRADNGPYATIEDLARVRGIGPKTVENISDMATVGD